MKDRKVFICIPHYKDKRLPECLEAIKRNTTYGNYKIIVAEDLLQKGIAENMNQVIKATFPDDIIKLDAHTIVLTGNWIWYLTEFLREHPDAGAISPLYTHSDGETIAYSPKWVINNRIVNLWKSGKPTETITEPVEVDIVSGACVYYTREVLNKVGGYNMIAGADTDLCLEMRKAGFKIYVIPQVKVWHSVGSYANMTQHNKWLREGMPGFEKKWQVKWGAINGDI